MLFDNSFLNLIKSLYFLVLLKTLINVHILEVNESKFILFVLCLDDIPLPGSDIGLFHGRK